VADAETSRTCSGTLERLGEACRVVEVAVPHADTPLREAHRLLRITDADPDPFRRHALQQPVDDGTAELTGGSGDDDHDTSAFVATAPTVSLILALVPPRC
jgi:hypothetical protein